MNLLVYKIICCLSKTTSIYWMGEKEWVVSGKNVCQLAIMDGGWQEKGGSVKNGQYLAKTDGCWPKTGGSWQKWVAWKWV